MAAARRRSRAAVFSAGSWGTAAAKILADADTDVLVHARRSEIADAIRDRASVQVRGMPRVRPIRSRRAGSSPAAKRTMPAQVEAPASTAVVHSTSRAPSR